MTNNVKQAQAAKEAAAVEAQLALDAMNAAKLQAATDRKAFVLGEANRLGRARAVGDTSLTSLCFLYNNAVRLGAMQPDDAGEVYAAYSGGFDTANKSGFVNMGENGEVRVSTTGDSLFDAGINADDAAEKDRAKVAISLVRTFAKPGCVAQGPGWFDRVRVARNGIAVDDRLHTSMFNAWVAANRLANDAADGNVSDAALVAALTKSAKAAKKSAAEKLAKLAADAAKLAKSNGADFAGLDKIAKILVDMSSAANLGLKMDVAATAKAVPIETPELVKAADVAGTKH